EPACMAAPPPDFDAHAARAKTATTGTTRFRATISRASVGAGGTGYGTAFSPMWLLTKLKAPYWDGPPDPGLAPQKPRFSAIHAGSGTLHVGLMARIRKPSPMATSWAASSLLDAGCTTKRSPLGVSKAERPATAAA